MTLLQAVTEILQRSDEAFIGVSEARARRMFYVAVTEAIRSGEPSDIDIRGLVIRHVHTFTAPATVTLATLGGVFEILRIRAVYLEPESYLGVSSLGTFITPATKEEIKKWGIQGLQPVYDYKYYQVGQTLYFYPASAVNAKKVVFEVVIAPWVYSAASPVPANHWGNNTELSGYFTTAFQNAMIEAAAQLLKLEVLANDG